MGDHWYLTFSEFSERFVSRYRIGASADGPWLSPAHDSIDGRAFYAPRTASDGQHRYAFGWIATREGETDDGPWQWAGSLAIHELSQRPDGSLAVSLPASIHASFDQTHELSPSIVAGRWMIDDHAMKVDAGGTFALARVSSMEDPCLITVSVRFDLGTQACGLALRMGEDPDEAYYIRLEPQRGVMVFDRWPRRAQAGLQWQLDGDIPHAVELERAVVLEPGVTHRLEVVVEGSACVTYLDGSVAMSARMYDRPRGDWGLFVTEGSAVYSGLSIRGRRSHMEEDASTHPR
jgi:beta-fructofuranosidase